MAAYRVVWECVVEQWLGVRRVLSNKSLLLLSTPSHCSTTQHGMLPQHLICELEFNCEQHNITLARNKFP